MACPHFYPVARLETNTWAVPPRLPLGDAYAGECRAQATSFQPDETTTREICNVGYGRECCERFPQDAGADAIRFHVMTDAGGLIRIQYIFEKNCWPREHGVFEFPLTSQELSDGPDAILRRQATTFLDSYRRRKAK